MRVPHLIQAEISPPDIYTYKHTNAYTLVIYLFTFINGHL